MPSASSGAVSGPHLRQWELNSHEFSLLLAEADDLGIDMEQARQIIEVIDRQASRQARRKTVRIASACIAAATVTIGGFVLWAMLASQSRAEARRQVDEAVAATEDAISRRNWREAEVGLVRVRELSPGSARLAEFEHDIEKLRRTWLSDCETAAALVDSRVADQGL